LFAVAVDVRANRLRVKVDAASTGAVEAQLPSLVELLGVPITAEVGSPGIEEDCISRDDCHDPFKAGIRIRKGSASSSSICTMAFHTVMGGDNETFVTAGHCGYSGSNDWYHTGKGYVGEELKTQYYSFGRDIMMVNMADSQASMTIYGEGARLVTGSEMPTVGQNVCASLGNSNIVDCGTINDDFLFWGPSGNACGCVIGGADHNGISTAGGDSGSPIYRRFTVSGQPRARAIGVHNRTEGYFAIVDDALYQWGDKLFGS